MLRLSFGAVDLIYVVLSWRRSGIIYDPVVQTCIFV